MFPRQNRAAGTSRFSSIPICNFLLAVLLFTAATTTSAQITPAKESLSNLYPGKAYSPYAQRSFPVQVYWGDTHLHTGLSMDAGLFGARLGLDDAYRFARGEEVMASIYPRKRKRFTRNALTLRRSGIHPESGPGSG